MSKVPYTKPALTYADQLQLVKARGLIVPDEAEFLRLMETKSYYRLSGYWYPLLDNHQTHTKYPNIDPAAMGFPADWENEPFWQ